MHSNTEVEDCRKWLIKAPNGHASVHAGGSSMSVIRWMLRMTRQAGRSGLA